METTASGVSRRSVVKAGLASLGAVAGAAALISTGMGGASAAPAVRAPLAPAPFVPTGPPVSARYLQGLETSITPAAWSVVPFALSQVRLAPSIFTRAQEQTLHLARVYPTDRVLAVFRRNAGIDDLGAEAPGGWEGFGHPEEEAWGPQDYPGRANAQTANLLRGHYGGHFLSMLAMAYAGTGEQIFKDKTDAVVQGLAQCQAALAATGRYSHPGFLAAYGEWQFSQLEQYAPYGEIWAPYYTCHKIMAGLLDAYRLTGSAEALRVVTAMGEWVHSRLSRLPAAQLERMWSIYIAGEYGGMNDVLCQLHAITGNEDFLDCARLFDLNSLIDACAEGRDILDGKHANQHIPQFPGYLGVYDATGDERYLEAVVNFWEMVVPGRSYAHGGTGEGELWGPPNTVAGDIGGRNAETCASYNMLKTSRLLFFHQQDPRYMDYYERTVTNHVLGSRRDRMHDTSPEVAYMFQVQPGGRKEFGNTGTCCGGTGLENHVKYQESIYFRAADGSALYVNLYIPSTLDWADRGVEVVQETSYPHQGRTTLRIGGSASFDLRLRIPYWATSGVAIAVNGTPQAVDVTPGTYATVRRTWADGDVVTLDLPLELRVEPTVDNPRIQSLHVGPVVLLLQNPSTRWQQVSLYKHMTLSKGFGRTITDEGENWFTLDGMLLEPAYSGEDSRYHMYVQRHEPRVVFAGQDTRVANAALDDGRTFLDEVWARGPFATRADFLAAVQAVGAEFQAAGALSRTEAQRILVTAGRARMGA